MHYRRYFSVNTTRFLDFFCEPIKDKAACPFVGFESGGYSSSNLDLRSGFEVGGGDWIFDMDESTELFLSGRVGGGEARILEEVPSPNDGKSWLVNMEVAWRVLDVDSDAFEASCTFWIVRSTREAVVDEEAIGKLDDGKDGNASESVEFPLLPSSDFPHTAELGWNRFKLPRCFGLADGTWRRCNWRTSEVVRDCNDDSNWADLSL